MKHVALILISFLFYGCGNTQVKEAFFGLEKKPYIEPDSSTSVAYLTVKAPKLQKFMVFDNTIRVSLYEGCVTDRRYRSEGHVGGFDLSTDESIGKSNTVKVAAGTPMFLEIGYDQRNVQCTNKFRIHLEENQNYEIVWSFERNACYAGAYQINAKGKRVESDHIISQNNKDSFWRGASGRIDSDWRMCSQSLPES